MKKNLSSPALPAIDGKMESAFYYCAYPWRIGKEKARAAFKFRYGSVPEVVFYGKPNGSILFAGPVPDMTPLDVPLNQGRPLAIKASTIQGIDK